jgi:hypothetical protein
LPCLHRKFLVPGRKYGDLTLFYALYKHHQPPSSTSLSPSLSLARIFRVRKRRAAGAAVAAEGEMMRTDQEQGPSTSSTELRG